MEWLEAEEDQIESSCLLRATKWWRAKLASHRVPCAGGGVSRVWKGMLNWERQTRVVFSKRVSTRHSPFQVGSSLPWRGSIKAENKRLDQWEFANRYNRVNERLKKMPNNTKPL